MPNGILPYCLPMFSENISVLGWLSSSGAVLRQMNILGTPWAVTGSREWG